MMNDRIHAVLDGDLPREALTPVEQARLVALEVSLEETAAALRAASVPDLTARVMASLPARAGAAAPARASWWSRAREWLWRPRTLSLSYRPAYALAGMAIAGTVVVSLPAPDPAPAPVAAVAERGRAPAIYVQFRLEAPSAEDVRLAGSFTGWQPELELEEMAPGVWTAMVPLQPGVHDYTFVVDGERWVVDPYAPRVEDSFGGANSRLFLPTPSGSA